MIDCETSCAACDTVDTVDTLDTLGRPLHDLRISLTDRCNFNCNYCMPELLQKFLPRAELLRFEEIARLVQIVSALGVRKVKLTGGEPLLRAGVDQLVCMLRQNPRIEDIGLITNGVFLPEFGPRLKAAGLDRISVSLDALDYDVFQKIAGQHYNVGSVLAGIAAAEELGFAPIKINCVVQRGLNEGELLPLVAYFRRPGFQLRFIEFMDVGQIHWLGSKVLPSAEILARIRRHYVLRPLQAGYYGEVARRYAHEAADHNDNGEVGFISAVSQPFCHSCTRLRLSSDGKLYNCLFGGQSLDAKALLRSSLNDNAVRSQIAAFWTQRNDRYSERRRELRQHTAHRPQSRQPMHFMGG